VKYFKERIEYPDPCKIGLPPGILLYYISNSFLNGWINYVEILASNIINRYQEPVENEAVILYYKEVQKTTTTYAGDYELLKLLPRDDLLILGKEKPLPEHQKYTYLNIVDPLRIEGLENIPEYYWFLWYDQDNSDCAIGRFETQDKEDVVIESFNKRCSELSSNHNYWDVKLPRCWLAF